MFLLASACSDGDRAARTTSTTSSTVRGPSRTSTTAAAPVFVEVEQNYTASGDFTNGYQIGRITAIDVGSRTVSVDFIQFLSGEEADRAYREDTGNDDTPPNDYYVRNASKRVRTHAVARSARITVNMLRRGDAAPDKNELIDLARLDELVTAELANRDADAQKDGIGPFGFTIKAGVVTGIEQLYVP